MKVDFEKEKEWWNTKAAREEQDFADEAIIRLLIWREIERHLQGIETILDIGAGTGAFSIPLAKRGFDVTHLDFASDMSGTARQKVEGMPNIHFVEANAADLSKFADQSFDLVLNMDGAISFCGSEAETALYESCRLAKKKLIITVSHLAWMVPVWVKESLAAVGKFLPAVYAMLEEGEWHSEQFPDNERLTKGYFGTLQAFLPQDLQQFLEQMGMRVLRCGGLGSLANLCGRFDTEVLPNGPGTKQRAGLIAVAERIT